MGRRAGCSSCWVCGAAVQSVDAPCYADVMSIRRITISVPTRIANRVKKAAGKQPVSTWLTELIEDHLEEAELERQWLEFYRTVAPAREATRRADAMFTRLTKPRRRRAA
jgi:hypothetical protein